MFVSRWRFALIFMFLGLGILLNLRNGIQDAWYLYVAALLLLVSHFAFGSVWTAFYLLKKGKLMEAEVLLNKIKRPNWLVRSNRAYYYFSQGLISLHKKEFQTSEQHLKQALALGLKGKNDKALATLNLSHINYVQKQWENAYKYLQETKTYEPDDLLLKQNIEKLESALANQG